MGVAFADILTGLCSVAAIQAALLDRHSTGRGCHLDMAVLDCQVGVLANQALNCMATGELPRRLGNAHPNIVPYRVFAVSDGHVIVDVGNDAQFRRFCQVLEAEHLADDPKHATNASRVENRAILVPDLEDLVRQSARDDVIARLNKAAVPVGPINTPAGTFADPQIRHRGMQIDIESPKDMAPVFGLRTLIMVNAEPVGPRRAAPQLGEHAREVLREIGRS